MKLLVILGLLCLSVCSTAQSNRSALFQRDWNSSVRPTIHIDLACVALADDDGSRPCATNDTELAEAVVVLNRAYEPAGIRFHIRSLRWRNTLLNSLDDLGDLAHPDVAAAVNQLRRTNNIGDTSLVGLFRYGNSPTKPSGQGLGGFPFRCVLVTARNATNAGPSMVAHEIGHALGLGHTFDKLRTYDEAIALLKEHGGDPACFDGDGLDDTPNDPGLPIRVVDGIPDLTGDTVSLDGTTIKLPVGNLMSYLGQSFLSPKQIQIARWHALATTQVNNPTGKTFGFVDLVSGVQGEKGWQIQDMSPYGQGNWSKNRIAFARLQPGQSSTFTIDLSEKGTYRISLFSARAPDYGVIDIVVNERSLRKGIDLYAPLVMASGEIKLGDCVLNAGKITVRVEASAAVTKGRNCVGLDTISFVRVPDATSGQSGIKNPH